MLIGKLLLEKVNIKFFLNPLDSNTSNVSKDISTIQKTYTENNAWS